MTLTEEANNAAQLAVFKLEAAGLHEMAEQLVALGYLEEEKLRMAWVILDQMALASAVLSERTCPRHLHYHIASLSCALAASRAELASRFI